MGLSMSYASTGPVSDAIRDQVLAEVEAINSSRDWWCEGLTFFDGGDPEGHLVGDTKLFLPGYSVSGGGYVEVDPIDDTFMAFRDGRYILDLLWGWSRAHGIIWEIEVVEPIGLVTADGPDESIQEFLEAVPFEAPGPPGSVASEEKAAGISAKYASRNT